MVAYEGGFELRRSPKQQKEFVMSQIRSYKISDKKCDVTNKFREWFNILSEALNHVAL